MSTQRSLPDCNGSNAPVDDNIAAGHGPLAPAWFALYTTPRHEKRVAEYLTYFGCENYLPLYSCQRRWKDRSKRVLDLPLFPGYVFAQFARSERSRVLSTPGVLAIVGRGTAPVPIEESEIELLRTMTRVGKPMPHPYLVVGDKVRIRSGALCGLEGVLTRIKSEIRIVCALDLIMQSVAVEVDAADTEPLQRSAQQKTLWH